jgi:hypothetical protein
MHRHPFLGVSIAAAVISAACNPTPPAPPAPKTVAYYNEHVAERDARLAVCKNDPGKLKGDPDCVNAAASVMAAWSKSDMLPITFAPASAASR